MYNREDKAQEVERELSRASNAKQKRKKTKKKRSKTSTSEKPKRGPESRSSAALVRGVMNGVT